MSPLSAPLDALATPIVWCDADGRLEGGNLAFSRWLGVSARRLPGLPMAALEMEGQRLAVPNSTLSSGKIINYSTLATRRLQHKITASYDDAAADVRRACLTAVGRTANVLADPAPVVYVSSYGESSIEYIVRCWTKTEDYWPAYYQLLEEIRNAFNEAGVEMCYNHLNVHIIEKKEETE